MIHVCTDEQCVNFVRTKMRYHLSDGLCINWEKRKRPQKHLQFLNFSKLFNLIACCLSFYSSAFHTNRDAFDMHVSNFCDHLLVQKEVGDCRYHAKKPQA